MKQTAMHTTSPWAPPELQPGVTAVLIISGLFMLAFGIWAFFAPVSFAEFVAFPYNRHLLHDAGAFQIGIGTTVMLALLWANPSPLSLCTSASLSATSFLLWP
jgi:hypothetical protein